MKHIEDILDECRNEDLEGSIDEAKFKKKLKALLLSVKPEKKNWPVEEGMPYDHAQQGWNAALDQYTKAIRDLFQ